jgi:hypothetical protein
MGFFEFFDVLHKIGRFIKAPIDAGIPNVGNGVEGAKAVHDARTDGAIGNFAVEFVGEFVDDLFDEIADGLLGHGTFLAGFEDAGGEFFPGKLFAAAIPFHDHQAGAFDDFVGGITMLATDAFASAPDCGSFA